MGKGKGGGLRFIPACAGNSLASSRGAAALVGSSPRVRGTRWRTPPGRRRGRFIPACAGNSRSGATQAAGTPVHPRVCGELTGAPCKDMPAAGSSPRVRGTLTRSAGSIRAHRFIPACAGNSQSAQSIVRCRAVHPRVCGELELEGVVNPYLAGSSPRVRGTPGGLRSLRQCPRFIPACAGNSHPPATLCRRGRGSSPRVRGTRGRGGSRLLRGRFIPACAGNSAGLGLGFRNGHGSSPRVRGTRTLAFPTRKPRTVHPRVCGELSRK